MMWKLVLVGIVCTAVGYGIGRGHAYYKQIKAVKDMQEAFLGGLGEDEGSNPSEESNPLETVLIGLEDIEDNGEEEYE